MYIVVDIYTLILHGRPKINANEHISTYKCFRYSIFTEIRGTIQETIS